MSLSIHAAAIALTLCASAAELEPEPTPTSAEENGWGPTEPMTTPPEAAPPPTAPAPAVTPTTAAPDEAEEKRLWQLRQHNRFKGTMISGFTILGSVYGASVVIGAIAIDLSHEDDDARQRQYGRRMMFPLGGPFAAAAVSRSATLGVLTVAAGIGQVLGLSMGIAGAVKVKQYPNPDAKRFVFGVAPSRDGAQVGMSLRF